MNVQLEQRKIAGVVIEVSQILADKGFNRGEIIIGLSELIGRLIVDSVEDTIQDTISWTRRIAIGVIVYVRNFAS